MTAQTHLLGILILILPLVRQVAPLVPTWCLLDGFPRAKDTEAIPEDPLLRHVVGCPTSTLLSKATSSPVVITTRTTSITKVVNTTTGISLEVTARKIIAEAEVAVVIVEAEAVGTTRTMVEVDMVTTRKEVGLESSSFFWLC